MSIEFFSMNYFCYFLLFLLLLIVFFVISKNSMLNKCINGIIFQFYLS
jgi:hypothetical protein